MRESRIQSTETDPNRLSSNRQLFSYSSLFGPIREEGDGTIVEGGSNHRRREGTEVKVRTTPKPKVVHWSWEPKSIVVKEGTGRSDPHRRRRTRSTGELREWTGCFRGVI